MKTIFRKELADIFSSVRFLIFLLLAILLAVATLYVDYQGIRGTSGSEFIFLALYTTPGPGAWALLSFPTFMATFLIPMMGIALGFDAVSSERTSGTLSRVLSQPIYRDNIINAKFLAGIFTLAVTVGTAVLLVAGYGIFMTGVPPVAEEIYRLIIFTFYGVVYGAFWMGLAILFSIVFRRTATSLIISVCIWLFFAVIYGFIATLIASTAASNAEVPTTEAAAADTIIKYVQLHDGLQRVSPTYLFSEASLYLLQPPLAGSTLGISIVDDVQLRGLGEFMVANPLSLGQTLLLVWPQLTTLLALTLICFAGSYIVFMRQEVRAT